MLGKNPWAKHISGHREFHLVGFVIQGCNSSPELCKKRIIIKYLCSILKSKVNNNAVLCFHDSYSGFLVGRGETKTLATEFLYFSLTFVEGKTCPKGNLLLTKTNKQHTNSKHLVEKTPILNFSKENMHRHAITMGCKCLIKMSSVCKQVPIDDAWSARVWGLLAKKSNQKHGPSIFSFRFFIFPFSKSSKSQLQLSKHKPEFSSWEALLYTKPKIFSWRNSSSSVNLSTNISC